jgi:hypothetical protein
MDLESFREEIGYLFHPEPDEDGLPPREYPNSRLREQLGLDFTYMESFDWEGCSTHKYTRLCPEGEQRLKALTRNKDVPERLLETPLHLMADSIIEYHTVKKKEGNIHYYPPVVLTFWAGFEAFVRYSSELLVVTVPSLPTEVVHYLREEEPRITKKGEIRTEIKYHAILDRYALFLKYAYDYEVDRGAKFWQALEKAKELRDSYTHLDISDPRTLKASEVLEFLEAVLLGVIVPSSHLQRTLMLGVYWLYTIWTCLYENYDEYIEKPFFFGWNSKEQYLFHCNFEKVDTHRFPSMREKREPERE